MQEDSETLHATTSDDKLDDRSRARYTLTTPDQYGIALHPETENLLFDSTALAKSYGGNCECTQSPTDKRTC